MSLDDVVNVQITIQSSALTLPGFGVPLLASIHSNFAERLRYYTDVAGMLADGFTASDRVVDMATTIFAQNPKPSRIAVGRREAAVAMVHTINVDDNTDGTYTIQIDGQNASFVAAADTATAIRDGLVAAVNALVAAFDQTSVTAAPSGTEQLTLTADTAGIPFSVTLTSPAADGLNFWQNVDVSGGGADGNYIVTIGSVVHTFAALGNTATQIRDGLVTLINAGASGVAASPGTAADTIDLDRQASAFVVTVASPGSVMTVSGRTLNVGMAEDLAAIEDEQPDWYLLLVEERSDDEIRANADYIETVRKAYIAQSSDATIRDTVYDSGNVADIAARLKSLSYARTAVVWTETDTNDIAAGWAGLQLPKTPASSTWKFKTVAGVTPDVYTSTQLNNLKSKSANGYREVAGRNIMFEGTVAEGEFLDVVRGVDKLFQTIQANTFGVFVKNEKVPFTNGGIALVGGAVSSALKESETDGLIATSRPNPQTGDEETPAFTVTVPNVIDINQADRAERLIPDTNPITFEGTLAGAIHAVNVRGTLSA